MDRENLVLLFQEKFGNTSGQTLHKGAGGPACNFTTFLPDQIVPYDKDGTFFIVCFQIETNNYKPII